MLITHSTVAPGQTSRAATDWDAPPGLEETEGAVTPEDTVHLSGVETTAPPRTRLRKAGRWLGLIGLGLTLSGSAAGLSPGPVPPVVCSTGMTQAQSQGQSRLGQVLACENVHQASQLTNPVDRASYAWEGLRASMGGMQNVQDSPSGGVASVWSYGQVMAAALDQAKVSGNYTDFQTLVNGLQQYHSPQGGYQPSVGLFGPSGNRYYDDNAWIGLDFAQAAAQVHNPTQKANYLKHAEEIVSFLRTGEQPNGALIWEENNPNPTYNTCAMGPAIELSLRLYQATGKQQYRDFASRMTRYMDSHLRQSNGLYADHVNAKTGKVSQAIYSYNQGTPVGAHLLWYQITGNKKDLEMAQQTARAALAHFGQQGLWKQSPAFNAIFFRNLLKLRDPQVRAAMNAYLNHVWNGAMAGSTGLFDRPGSGMGHYGGHGDISSLDQAGLVELYALQGWSPAAYNTIS